MPSRVSPALVLRAAAALLIGALVLPAVPDVDLWGHTLFGGDILRTGGVPTSDPYSFTSDVPWINHEWASELVMYASFALSGGPGLVALRALLIALTLAIVVRAVRRDGASIEAVFPMLAVLALVTYPRTQHVRPQLFSLVAFAALLATLMRYDQTRSWRSLIPAPLVMLAWANFHGGFLVGLVPVGAWGLKVLFDRHLALRQKAAAAAVLACSAPLTLVNPYGVGLWQFLWSTVGLGRADISEWWSVAQSGAGVFLFWVVTAAVAVVVAVRSPERPAWHRVILVAGLGYASFRVSRLDAFFAIVTVMTFGRSLGALLRSPAATPGAAWRPAAALSTAALLVAFAGASVALLRASSNDGCRELPSWLPDQRSAVFVAENRLEGKILVFFNWGEFVIWHFAPALQVSTDGRRETVYSDRHIQGHLEVYKGSAAGTKYLRQLAPDYVWLPRTAAIIAQIEGQGWTRIFEGERSLILARHDLAVARHFAQPAGNCFESANGRQSPIRRGLWSY
jgi:hypothetical protein